MSVQLVIAEKPSVARSIAAVIGATEKQNGYWQGLSTIMLPVMKYVLTINDPTYINTGDEADIHVFAESVLGAGRKTGSFVESKLITLDDVPHEILKAGILSRLSNRNSSSLKHIPIWKTMRRIK